MPTEKAIRDALHELKATYALKKVSLFGSYAEDRATEHSDLDLLVEFEQSAVSLIQMNALKFDLEDALGLPVDIIHAPLPVDCMIRPKKVVRVL